MNATSRSRKGGASKRPPVPPFQIPETIDPYVAVGRPKRVKPTPDQPPEPELVEMSAIKPLLWLFVPLVLAIVYGALSTWLKF